MYRVLLRWADAIVYRDGVVYIIEAKLRPSPTAIGQLEMYKDLFYRTPEFTEFFSCPVQLVFLTTRYDWELVEFCSKKGIKYVVIDVDKIIEEERKRLKQFIETDSKELLEFEALLRE
ncbi:MAG: hypothetical protein Q6368_003070 [Candidatus Baldrarchaeota archaeon]